LSSFSTWLVLVGTAGGGGAGFSFAVKKSENDFFLMCRVSANRLSVSEIYKIYSI
jgi:hypothetical protein